MNSKKKTVIKVLIIAAAAVIMLSVVLFIGGILFAIVSYDKSTVVATVSNTSPQSVMNNIKGAIATAGSEPVRAEKMKQIGKHIYFEENMIDSRNLDRKEKNEILDYLEDLDATLTGDIYVTGFTKIREDNIIRVYARQYINGAVVDDVYYASDFIQTPNIVLASDFHEVTSLDTSSVIAPDQVIGDVLTCANANLNKMNVSQSNPEIYGTYKLQYSVFDGKLYYSFILNEYSEVKVDALTGAIYSEYYWDGIYED